MSRTRLFNEARDELKGVKQGDGKEQTRNKASAGNRLLDMATLEWVFSRRNVLNDPSRSGNVIGTNAQTFLRFSGKNSPPLQFYHGLSCTAKPYTEWLVILKGIVITWVCSDELALNTTCNELFALLLLSVYQFQVVSSNWFANNRLLDIASTLSQYWW